MLCLYCDKPNPNPANCGKCRNRVRKEQAETATARRDAFNKLLFWPPPKLNPIKTKAPGRVPEASEA